MRQQLNKYGPWIYAAIAQLVLIGLVISRLTEADTIRYYLNTDYLYLPALYEDIFKDGNSITSWRLTPAPYFFPDMLLYAPIYAITSSIPVSALIFGFCQLLLIEFLFYKICRELFEDVRLARQLIACSIFLLQLYFIITILSPTESFFSCLLLTNTCHLGSVVSALFGIWLLLRYTARGQKKYLLLLLVLVLVALTSDRLFIVHFIFPTIGWILFRIRKKGMLWALLTIVLSALAGWYLFKFIQHNLVHIPEALHAPVTRSQSLDNFIKAMGHVRKYYPFTQGIFILHLLSALLLGVALFRMPANKKPGFILLAMTIASSFVLPVLLGHIQGPDTLRYLNYAYYLLLMLLPVSLYFICRSWPGKLVQKLLLGVYSSILILLMILFFSKEGINRFIFFKPGYVEVIEKNDVRLKNGIADYWFTKHVYLLGGKKHRVVSVYEKGEPYVYQCNESWYAEGGHQKQPVFNFSIDIKPNVPLVIKDSIPFENHTLYIFEDFVFERSNDQFSIRPL